MLYLDTLLRPCRCRSGQYRHTPVTHEYNYPENCRTKTLKKYKQLITNCPAAKTGNKINSTRLSGRSESFTLKDIPTISLSLKRHNRRERCIKSDVTCATQERQVNVEAIFTAKHLVQVEGVYKRKNKRFWS